MPSKLKQVALRLDPELEFGLAFAIEATGKTQQKFAESAVREALEKVKDSKGYTWSHYWDSNEAFRSVKLLVDGTFPKKAEEHRMLDFIRAHGRFFFTGRGFNREAIDVLWPEMPKLVREWHDSRKQDYQGTAKKMESILEQAGVFVPDTTQDAEF